MSDGLKIAVVGATGAVGEVLLELLAERVGSAGEVHALASERSLGKRVSFGRRELDVADLAEFDFSGVDFALFSAGASVSREHAPGAAAAGCTVIDNTSEFRYREDIPLVVPEVNGDLLDGIGPGAIIANPNCSTIQLVVAVAPIHRAAGIERINVATYQSVSGAGRRALEELARQTADRLNLREIETGVFRQPIAFNVLPEIDALQDNGYTREEMKLHWETGKILRDDTVQVNATAVRVPVFFGHSEAVHLETREAIGIEEARALLQAAPGVVCVEDEGQGYATAVTHAAGHDPVYVSRLRRDHTHPRGIDLWIVADNVRKGAALNAVQILERISGNPLAARIRA
ncbi:MAG: aspartate-semialdehyde dehydrogenase [Xanthomonadales bacterium]|nr:aspartate-semialdehyde dehydrogenase [Xanthomonadales bacterium]NIN60728.1 aspartate-semialdehyde dehydrogenase [Xanthomonadales bacterium]NIN76090.1 aspartate-semialdehyde dehydrogenase [Xanthomonadales bacterium]NIO15311.1 aspartate-semialdehyde dehydrogenase [Xanthomonadales bacterium]NIP13121.1 aspartate-semialdehyde dehydrogenase [Xanthomonadales bacterium]